MEEKEKKNQLKKGIFVGAAVAVLVCTLIFGSVLLGITVKNRFFGNTSAGKGASGVNAKINKIESILEKNYYGEIDEDALTEGIYEGILGALDDDYAEYYSKEEVEELNESITGEYAGIGAVLQQVVEDKKVLINKVFKGSPAEKAGLMKGDQIIAADDHLVTDCASLDEFVTYVRGDKGTKVDITYIRNDKENKITLTRDIVQQTTAEGQMVTDSIGYIEISSFADNTKNQFDETLKELEAQGMTSLIIDLRSNGGGLVDITIDMLDEILPEGDLMYLEDANGKRTTYTSSGRNFVSYDIVILTSEYTASASEIFAGAMRDFDYATIIGTKTFGKGIVQDTVPLSDGSMIKYTAGKYYLPSGECIHEVGIEPDIELEYKFLGDENDEYSFDLDNQIQKAISVLEEM